MSSSSKRYLEPTFRSLSEVYQQYKVFCVEQNQEIASRYVLEAAFHQMNLSLFKPKKDMCDTCLAYKAGNVGEQVWLDHMERANEARENKESEKSKPKAGEKIALSVDVQAVLLCPYLNASILYYKMKLACHNYTIFDLTSKEVMCYFWNEVNGGLEGNIFASCLEDYITHRLDTSPAQEVQIFSDGCGYQNMNLILANCLLHLAVVKNIRIIQTFLERDHTQMEVDSVHSTIERKRKGAEIFVPAGYIDIIKNARKRSDVPAYDVKYLTYEFFKDYSHLVYYTSIRPGSKVGDTQVNDLR